ncbi:sigma-70 family RNA polymerase sigma factor [Catenovulum sp. SM1970]|uniref:sigma-70 family RNA polymerase sigma factor n=1 Tax=Marinifaba aquimaris TaxID=2741323 RepID=UPI0015726164|nr:sigma-70 family RNA polymerase sigma factor [Marinifaba aquimaris]NTS77843.1 sigma-70 family RNA polymerase sigma factor [Marinifaba aquimaris]
MFKLGKKNSESQVLSDMNAFTKQKRYEALVQAYHQDIYRYGYWLTGDASVAEDITQETFLRAWKSLDSLKDEKAAKSWLITIFRRENARRFERKQFDIADVDEQTVSDDFSATSEQQIEQHWLHKHIASLEAEYREPLVLQVIGGFTGDEIAEILELNSNTVMTRLFRAKNQLKAIMDESNTQLRVVK